MKYATKLDFEFDISALSQSLITPHQKYDKVQRYSKNMPGHFVGSETKNINNADSFISQLPKKLIEIEKPYVFLLEITAPKVSNPVLPAHVDLNKTCGINIYLETYGEKTKFYHWNKEKRECEYGEEFCSNTGDIWLMNTSVPHSVDLIAGKVRRILTFSFTKLKYNEVLECFKKK